MRTDGPLARRRRTMPALPQAAPAALASPVARGGVLYTDTTDASGGYETATGTNELTGEFTTDTTTT